MRIKLAVSVALLLALSVTAAAQAPPSPRPAPSAAKATDKATDNVGAPSKAKATSKAAGADTWRTCFDIVWQTVKDKHFDPTFGGVDWDKVRTRYEPRLSAIKSDAELYSMLQQMVGELHQSHFQIIPPEAVVEAESPDAAGAIGIDLRMIDEQATITRVEPKSAAERAGLHAGFVVKRIDSVPVTEVARKFARSVEHPPLVKLFLERTLLARIGGAPGSTLRLVYLDENGAEHESNIVREPRGGETSPAFGNLPPQHIEFEAKRLSGNVGYIRFNIFVTPLIDRILSAIRQMSDAPGIIIDLRGNPGGVGAMACRLAGALETNNTSLGQMRMRSVPEFKFFVFGQKNAFQGKVVLLMDSDSGSTSEVFAAGLQEIGRASVVGERSLGAALPSVIQRLPTGALFQYAIGDFRTPSGVLVEGRGVIPDREAKLTRSTLLQGRDAQLEAAIEQILTATKK